MSSQIKQGSMSIFDYEEFFLCDEIMKKKNKQYLIQIAREGLRKRSVMVYHQQSLPCLDHSFKRPPKWKRFWIWRNLRKTAPADRRGRRGLRDSRTRKMSTLGTNLETKTTTRVLTKRVTTTGHTKERRGLKWTKMRLAITGLTRIRGCQPLFPPQMRKAITGLTKTPTTLPALTKQVQSPPHQVLSLVQ